MKEFIKKLFRTGFGEIDWVNDLFERSMMNRQIRINEK